MSLEIRAQESSLKIGSVPREEVTGVMSGGQRQGMKSARGAAQHVPDKVPEGRGRWPTDPPGGEL